MGIEVIGSGGGGLKSIQRGEATVAGTITISEVDPAKTTVNSFSTGSDGSVAASGIITGVIDPVGGSTSVGSGNRASSTVSSWPYESTVPDGFEISGGSTNLVSAVYGAYLTSATTIEVTGPCRYEILEFE